MLQIWFSGLTCRMHVSLSFFPLAMLEKHGCVDIVVNVGLFVCFCKSR